MTEYRYIYVKKRTFRIGTKMRSTALGAVDVALPSDIRVTEDGDIRITEDGDVRITANFAENAYPPRISARKRTFRILAKVNNG